MGRAPRHRARAQAPPRRAVGQPPPRAGAGQALARAQPRRAARAPARHPAGPQEPRAAAAAPARRLRQPPLLRAHHLRYSQGQGHGGHTRGLRQDGAAGRPHARVELRVGGGAMEVSLARGDQYRPRRWQQDIAAGLHEDIRFGQKYTVVVGESWWDFAAVEVSNTTSCTNYIFFIFFIIIIFYTYLLFYFKIRIPIRNF